jgi:AcrR family transcriptional regulator
VALTSTDRGREVRERLLAAAVDLIAERGWGAVSTRVLAERAGVGSGLVHYHFPSLRALLGIAAVGLIRRVAHGLSTVLLASETPEHLVESMVAALDDYTGRDPVSLVFVETYLATTRDETLRAEVAGVLAEVRDRIGVWFGEHGVAEPEHTAAVLVAAMDGLVLHRALNPDLTAAGVGPVLRRIVREE